MIHFQRILFPLVFSITAVCSSASLAWENSSGAPFDEAKVFEWWDDGLISGEEASELLDKLQEENLAEACHLAQTLALDACIAPHKVAEKQVAAPEETRNVRGSVGSKTQVDSLGNVSNSALDLDVKFYRLALHLGSRNLLSYKNDKAEAYFGQIASKEFHSQIPTDTLWGTVLYYPVGKFRLQGVLDTSLNAEGAFSYLRRGFSAGISAWHHHNANSIGIQTKVPAGEIAGWWQLGQSTPLIKLQLQKTSSLKDSLQFSWKTSAYFHGKEIPEQVSLSSTLLKNRFTGTQSIALSVPSGEIIPWAAKFSANIRVLVPVESDSLKSRLKFAAETGPETLHGSASFTCLETANQCRQKDFKLQVSSEGFLDFSAGASVSSRHNRDQGFSAAKTESFLKYQPAKNFSSKISIAFPKGNPQKQVKIRNETALKTEHFQSSLVVTFRRIQGEKFHPVHGLLQAKWLF